MIIPVILSGGSGTRLWPLSTPAHPKQFLRLVGEESLFRQTIERVADSATYESPVVVGSARHEALCSGELQDLSHARLILEPVARNTAVAIIMAAALVAQDRPDAILLVMPSDHRIGDSQAFHRAAETGAALAMRDFLVTFGIEPAGPETGYGYLEAGEPIPNIDDARRVACFKEKPDLGQAKAMLATGGHYWNGGIFMFRANTILNAAKTYAPEVYRCGTGAVAAAEIDGRIIRPDAALLEKCPDISIDYAVMERAEDIAMVTLDADWSDVGSWDALADLATARGDRPLHSIDSENSFVLTDGLDVALLGVDDLIVVGRGNQLVIMKRGRSQDIKRLAAVVAND